MAVKDGIELIHGSTLVPGLQMIFYFPWKGNPSLLLSVVKIMFMKELESFLICFIVSGSLLPQNFTQWKRKKGCHSYLTTVGLSQQHPDDVSCLQKSVYYFLQPIWTIPGRNGGLLWWLFSWRVLDLLSLLRPHNLFSKLYLSPAMGESRGAARVFPHSWVFSVDCCWLGYAPMLFDQCEEMSYY